MFRIYLFIIITAFIIGIYYREPLISFFTNSVKSPPSLPSSKLRQESNSTYEQLGIELYRAATKVSELQGKTKLLEMAQENKAWFKEEEGSHLEELKKEIEEELKIAEQEYQKIKEDYAKMTVQKMLDEFSEKATPLSKGKSNR